MKSLFVLAVCLTGVGWLAGQEVRKRATAAEKHPTARELSELTTDQRIAAIERMLKTEPRNTAWKLTLGSAFLQKMRETADFEYLRRAEALSDGVLRADAESYEGQRLAVEIEMQKHEFPQAAEGARRLLDRNTTDTGMLGMLGDALMEMGKCEEAGRTYKRMVSLGGNLFSYNRLAFHAFITGDLAAALGWMSEAVAAGSPSKENLAWVQCEMGDLLWKAGRAAEAERAYRSALEAFPGYHRAQAGLGSVAAARAEWKAAIARFKQAQAVVPWPQYAAALEALYNKVGDQEAAGREQTLVDAVHKLMAANGETANRALVLIYADTGRKLARALELAQAEFAVRNDVASWDALSWALFKNKRVKEAREASAKALVYGTPDPMFFYHAGEIAAAAGESDEARRLLTKALALNPAFDFRYAPMAKADLERLGGTVQMERRGVIQPMETPVIMRPRTTTTKAEKTGT